MTKDTRSSDHCFVQQTDEAQSIYEERWQIETVFKALKTNSFNIEDTYFTDIVRLLKDFNSDKYNNIL